MPRSAAEELDAFSTGDILSELRRRYRVLSRKESSFVIIGPPGVGKASLRDFASREFGVCRIDAEKLLMKTSEETLLPEISKQLALPQCRRGFSLSSFPRTVDEARNFDAMLNQDFPENQNFKNYRVVSVSTTEETPEEILKERYDGKKTHLPSGRIYGASDEIDEITGDKLSNVKRISSFESAMNLWNSQRDALLEFFKGRLTSINGDGVLEDLEKRFLADL